MCENKVLLILSTLNLDVRHLLVCEQLIVLSEDERPLGLLQPLDELKVHDIIHLVVTHLYNILGLDHLDSLLVKIFFVFFCSPFNLEFVFNIVTGVKEKYVNFVLGNQNFWVSGS